MPAVPSCNSWFIYIFPILFDSSSLRIFSNKTDVTKSSEIGITGKKENINEIQIQDSLICIPGLPYFIYLSTCYILSILS